MIRKGLRPAFRVGLDLPGNDEGFRRVFPFRRSWVAIVALAVFDAIFLVPAFLTFQQAASQWARLDSLFELTAAVFLTAWLIGWSIAPLIMTTILVLMLFGREVLRIGPGTVDLMIGIPGVGLAASFDVTRMRNLRFAEPAPKTGRSWRGPHLVFDYGANDYAFGTDMKPEDVAAMRSTIQMSSGKLVRRGDAREDEITEDWEPSALAAVGVKAAPVEAEVVTPAKPVTLASPSTLALVIANLVPLAGTVFLGWRLSDVMVLYWAESAVIGFWNICKIIVIGRWAALLAGPFFLGHFGAFMAVHFLFIYSFFVQGIANADSGGRLSEVSALFISLWPALLALFLSHGLSFWMNFMGKQEYRGRTVSDQMSEPYSRIIFMHLVLIFGGGLSLVLGEPTPVLLLVIAVKVFVDIRAHIKERSRGGKRSGASK